MNAQDRDNLCMFLDGRGYPDTFGKDQKRRLREKAASFVLQGGELHHKTGKQLYINII